MTPAPRAADLLRWLAAFPPEARDAAIEARLGIAEGAPDTPPAPHCIGYHASGIAPIVRALIEVPVTADDVFIDLGSGLGKVTLLTALLTGATAKGVELQPTLVDHARASATAMAVDVRYFLGDARESPLDDGTVFFLYVPFTGSVLANVLERVRGVALRRSIVVCTLGVDVDRAPWLARRELDAFWLSIYDSRVPGVPARSPRASPLPSLATEIAYERRGALSTSRED